jgi:hypothetical protein
MSYDPLDHDFERGMRNRRSVLGDAWVDRSVANATNFNADFQNLITRFAWNEMGPSRAGPQDPAHHRAGHHHCTGALGRI